MTPITRSRTVASTLSLSLALSLAAGSLAAQAAPAADFAVSTARAQWERLSQNVLAAAEAVPEDKYAFKPTPDVRSFGQLVGHVAGAQNMICAAAMGEQPKAEDDIEKSKTTKADLVAAMKASNEYCAKAYQQTDAASQAQLTLFGMQMTRLGALMLNATHDGEHYGNMVTYMRLNGIVPPSSRGR